METKANYVIVGIFTIVAILAAFGFVYWTAGVGNNSNTAPIRFRIPGSAAGLVTGSAVLFNGVRVGTVERVYLDGNNPGIAIADARVDRTAPITPSTKADVGLASLTTGQANIDLTGGNPQEPKLITLAEEQGTIAVMTANPSAVSNLLQSAQSLMSRADSVVGELENFVSDARGPLTQTVRNVEAFSNALARNSEGIDNFLANVGELSESISGVSGQLESTLSSAEELINSVDRNEISKIVENLGTFTERLGDVSGQFDTIATGVNDALGSLSSFSTQAGETLQRVDRLVAGIDPDQLTETLSNFEEASQAINKASAEIAEVAETVSDRTDDIDQFITDARELASRLNAASVRVDGVLAKLDGMLGSGEGQDLFAEASSTLRAFRQTADTLNARLGPITDGLTRFSGQGLRDVEALVGDARRAISRIESAVSDLEQNPQRIITGGDGTIRRYDGRARR
ncbi:MULTISPECIES: MCE family protein [Chelativorans]|jgi:phospholipid/cholesterol/gamma-HCH transport system substrate-binding protein|uniref:Mammalian cell entry related protein n=1 Tax=Chelativorans sp. (strain BNC1) TaxID=266779 RepID=Q11I37_CHESB|nr:MULTISPECIES: MlaD family protein [Chelativorans]